MMDWILPIVLLIVGLVLVSKCADLLVEGAKSVARRAGLSEFLIGLTIMGFGTSCPELVVSLTGAFQGNAAVSVGNILGSNICNTMLILGLVAVVNPFDISRDNRLKDLPMLLLVSFLFVAMGLNRTLLGMGQADALSRVEGIVLLLVFAAYMIYCFRSGNKDEEPEDEIVVMGRLKSAAFIVFGLAGLIGGGSLFVNSAVKLAGMMGISDKFIAVTILAVGTSLPEIVTSVKMASRNCHQMLLGNVIGSNLFNILLILGLTSTITPLSMASIEIADVLTLIASAVMLWLWSYTGGRERIDRWEGAILLVGYICYMAYLVIKI